MADLVDKARAEGSTTVGWHDTETQIEMHIRKHNRVKPTGYLVSRSSYVQGIFFLSVTCTNFGLVLNWCLCRLDRSYPGPH